MVKNTHSCIPSKFLLEALLEHPDFSDFESKGEDDWRPPASKFKNSGFSISSKGWSLHADKGERREYNLNGTSGSLFDLAKARSLQGQAKVKSSMSEQISAKKSVEKRSNDDIANELWKKAIQGNEAHPFIEGYLTKDREIPPANYIDLVHSGHLRFLPANGPYPAALVHPFHFIGQDGSISEEIHKIHLTRPDGVPRKKHLGSAGHLSIFPPLDSENPDNCLLVTEGLEDALTMRNHYPRKVFVVTGSKANLKHLNHLAKPGEGVLIIADHDDHAKPNENGQFEAARVRKQLKDKGVNCVARMPEQPNWDANAALQQNNLKEWSDSLVEVLEHKEPEQPTLPGGFHFLRFGELAMQTPEMLVGHVLECGTLAELYGDSNTGKSFVALDLAFSVATGCLWHGEAVQQGGVLYLAGEGREGLIRRRQAWEIARGQSLEEAPVYLSSEATDLTDEERRQEVLAKIREKAEQVSLKLVVIDTLSRHFGKDENQTVEMSQFVSALDSMRQEFGVTVLLVHHTGKDANKGPRGSNALRAALDNEILVTRKDHGPVVLTNTKMKDAEPFRPMAFQLVAVNLQDDQGRELADDYGQPVTSCVLETAEVPRQTTRTQPKKGSNQKAFDRVFTQQQQLGQSPVSLEVIRSESDIPAKRFGELLSSQYIQQKYHIADNYVVLKCLD